MVEPEEKGDESSKYNEAALQIMRLHNLWTKIEEQINKGNLIEWQFLLDSVWRELRADVNHLSEKKKKIKQNKYYRLKVLVAASHTKSEWYSALNERHEFLKELQDEVGKGGVFTDGRDEDFE